MQLLTIEKITTDFAYVKSWEGGEVYQDPLVFIGHGNFCDVYFRNIKKQITQKQVDDFNAFVAEHKKYVPEIEDYISTQLNSIERRKKDDIRDSILDFEVIEVAYENPKYDLILICSKTYAWLLFKKHITIRVELKNGQIKTIRRPKDITIDNE